jgi:hypothetical protein
VHSDPADRLKLLASVCTSRRCMRVKARSRRHCRRRKYLPVSYVLLSDGTPRRVEPPTPFTSPEQVRATVQRYLGATSTRSGS